MTIAAISSVTSSFAALPVGRVQGFSAPTPAAAGQTAAPAKTVNFGPAVTVSLSPAAQSLIASASQQGNVSQAAAANANNTAAAPAQTPNAGALALTYQSAAEQVWVQVLGSLGYTQAELDALPLSQRTSVEQQAENLAEVQMNQQIQAPAGVSATEEASSISAAIQAVSAA